MQHCPNCGQQNRPGVIFCENCGASLIGKLPLSTRALDSTESEQPDVGVDSSTLTDVSIQGTATFEHGMLLRLEVEGNADPIRFTPKAETIFGRRDPATGDKPDIDLTPFAGYRMGVSRRHAAIRPGDENGLDLWDLGSSNGTFLNTQRLSAHRPYRLRDGDEIRLGQMVIRIYFERETSFTPVPPPAQVEAQPPPEAPSPEPAAAAPAPPLSEDRPTEPLPPGPRPKLEAVEAKAAVSQEGKPVEAQPEPSAGPPAPDRPVPAAPEPDQPAGPPAPDRPVPAPPIQAPEPADEPAPQPEPEPKAEPPVPLDNQTEPKAEQPAPDAPVPTSPDAPKPAEPALPAEPPEPAPQPKPSPEPGDKNGG